MDNARRSDRTKEGTMEAIKDAVSARLPIARESLPARYDVLGRPLEARKAAAVDPTLPSTAREMKDPLDREIVRHSLGISSPEQNTKRQWKQGGQLVKDPETEQEFLLRSRARGLAMQDAMRRVIAHPRYASSPPERQKAALEKAMNRAQDIVSDAVRTPRYARANQAERVQMLNQLVTRLSK